MQVILAFKYVRSYKSGKYNIVLKNCAVRMLLTLVVSFLIIIVSLGLLFRFVYNKTARCNSYTCLVGKTAIVTGSNTGIGYVTALDFAKRGARVVLACRNKEKAEEARAKIVEETGNQNVVVKLIDMSSFKSVRKFAEDINNTEERLDILVNNAGAADGREENTEDGNVFLMQVNYLSPFLLTILLIGLLKKSGRSRIVNVGSVGAAYAKNFNVNNLNVHPGFQLYINTKLCNILFTVELAKKLKGTNVTTYALHPGAVKTEILRYAVGIILRPTILFLGSLLFLNSEQGAQTTIYTSVAKGIEKYSGGLFDHCQRVPLYKTASDEGLAKKLWEKTETLVQLKPEEMQF